MAKLIEVTCGACGWRGLRQKALAGQKCPECRGDALRERPWQAPVATWPKET